MLFWTAYTSDGTLNFTSSLGLPRTFSLKDALNLSKLPVSLWKQKGRPKSGEAGNSVLPRPVLARCGGQFLCMLSYTPTFCSWDRVLFWGRLEFRILFPHLPNAGVTGTHHICSILLMRLHTQLSTWCNLEWTLKNSAQLIWDLFKELDL